MSQEERIDQFMSMMQDAQAKTGIAVAVEAGQNLTVFDTKINEPVELEITTGTEVVKENGRTSVTVFAHAGLEE